ncbi:hypothetical protein SAMN05192569_104821, partial [Parageobacillus thermantarcticus]
PPDDETERGNVGAKTPGDMGGFVLISDAEIQGCIEYASPRQENVSRRGREAHPGSVRYPQN